MKKLTNHELDWYNEPGCNHCSAYCYESCVQDNFVKDCLRRLIWLRLSEIEDILGEEYDLEMLKNHFTFDKNYPIITEYNPEECSCNGNLEKCTFYPEKRKENKIMNTAEMYLQAINDGKFYQTSSSDNDKIFYQKDRGLFEEDECPISIHVWDSFKDLMTEQWELCNIIMTKTEAKQKFGIQIID